MKPSIRTKRHRGFSLIEVLIAVVVLSIGLLALAALQARLARGGAESKIQTVALSIAQERIEEFRNFGFRADYQEIDSEPAEVIERQGAGGALTRSVEVTRWVWDTSTQAFVQAASNTDTVGPREFKEITVNVGWTDADGSARSVVLRDLISAAAPADAALTLRDNSLTKRQPRVHIFTPSEAGIIPIAIGDDRAAASSNPKPELTRHNTSTLTQFNVQTYRTDTSNPLLQRRIDFAVINCQCRLTGNVSSNTQPAFEPTYWNGVRYVPPQRIPEDAQDNRSRPIGVSEGRYHNGEDFQEYLCDTCCRDHHDPAIAEMLVDPFRPSDDRRGGNHSHFTVGGTLVTDSSTQYHEVCRMVRVDGVMRVATDTRLENLTLLRMEGSASPLLSAATAKVYADFAIDFVETAMDNYRPGPASSATVPYHQFPEPDLLIQSCEGDPLVCTPTPLGENHDATVLDLQGEGFAARVNVSNIESRWLAARGLYIDFLSDETRKAIACIGDTTDPNCRAFRHSHILELVPFVAINLTGLASFGSERSDIVKVRNDAISNVAYIRGKIEAQGNGEDNVFVNATGGNAQLVDRAPASPWEDDRDLEDVEFRVKSESNLPPPPKFTFAISSSPARLAGFDATAHLATITAPAVSSPTCARGSRKNEQHRRACDFSGTTQEVELQFSNYNTCPGGYTWDAVDKVCETFDRKGNRLTAPLHNFKYCHMTGLPTGVSASQVPPDNNVVVADEGTPQETTVIKISSSDGQPLVGANFDPEKPTIHRLTGALGAVFGTTCTGN
jgi:prepilin-type N-terminal cleavage/methylation domain-containing protein